MSEQERTWGSDLEDKRLERMERIAEQDAAGQLIGGPRGDQRRNRGWTRPDTATVLTFEARWPRHNGAKEEAIRATFHVPAVRYYQILHTVIDTREALELNPMLVNRLRDTREERAKERASRTFTRRTR